MKAIVDQADNTEPRFNDAFREYAQASGFVIDPARVRRPQDKPRVEKCVRYVRSSFFAGEEFTDLADCRARAEQWCAQVAATRIHGTTRARPGEVFTSSGTRPPPGRPHDRSGLISSRPPRPLTRSRLTRTPTTRQTRRQVSSTPRPRPPT